MRALILSVALCMGLAAPLAQAQGAADVDAFKTAVALSQGGDWLAAETALAEAGPLPRAVMRWLRLRDGPAPAEGTPDPRDPDPAFADYAAFLAAYPHWPGLDRLRAQGELVIPAGADPAAVIAYFAGVKPQTGEGAAALARALTALGRGTEGDAVVAEAWLTIGISARAQAELLSGWSEVLAPLHAARVDEMLWRWRVADAQRVMPLIPEDRRAVAEARIALIRDTGDRNDRMAAVPDALQGDPGLAVDRFNRLAEDGDYTDAVTLLLARTGDAAALGQPFRWASWRATLARWALREGRPDEAYRLASLHHLTPEGASRDFYADLEWVAGYASLRFLNDPATALAHFQRMEAAVTGPISLSRAAYWTARAQEALGQDATASLTRAAQHQTGFYGLLAAERLGLPLDPALAGQEIFADWRTGSALRSDLTAAMLMLVAAGDRNTGLLFAARLGQTLPRDEIGQIGALLTETGEPFLALVVSKAAQERGILIPAMHYPVHPMARMDLPVSADLALSIARQESEFNIAAGSGVGALGLMQLMPGTAQEVADDLDLPYERARLTTDWEYNATLGSAYLAGLQEMFGPSPVMIAAGYNAGPGRPRQWMTLRGDPRVGEADVIDWIESIPFAETRNYVMRVTEAMPVYQARLTGQTGPVRFLSLLNGARPLIRPVARPVRDPAAAIAAAVAAMPEPAAQIVADNAPTAAATPNAPLVALRPVARP